VKLSLTVFVSVPQRIKFGYVHKRKALSVEVQVLVNSSVCSLYEAPLVLRRGISFGPFLNLCAGKWPIELQK